MEVFTDTSPSLGDIYIQPFKKGFRAFYFASHGWNDNRGIHFNRGMKIQCLIIEKKNLHK